MSQSAVKAGSKNKKRKLLTVLLTGFLLFAVAGIFTGAFDNVFNFCKAFIYCNTSELPVKK